MHFTLLSDTPGLPDGFPKAVDLGERNSNPCLQGAVRCHGLCSPHPQDSLFSLASVCTHSTDWSWNLSQWSVIRWVIQSPHLRMRPLVIFCSEPWPLSTVIPTSLKQFPFLPGRQVHSGYFAFSILALAQWGLSCRWPWVPSAQTALLLANSMPAATWPDTLSSLQDWVFVHSCSLLSPSPWAGSPGYGVPVCF